MAILVVDDEPLVFIELSGAFRDAGFETLVASNADDAWTMLHEGPSIRLVCTDVRMPGTMDGIELAKRIRADFPSLLVIIISGELTAQQIPDIAHARLMKPIDTAVLVATVQQLLGSQTWH